MTETQSERRSRALKTSYFHAAGILQAARSEGFLVSDAEGEDPDSSYGKMLDRAFDQIVGQVSNGPKRRRTLRRPKP